MAEIITTQDSTSAKQAQVVWDKIFQLYNKVFEKKKVAELWLLNYDY